ncbi:MAG: helix-hairpin-helix domain-containing protein [Saprospiraceae bacterium]|nr:helix-hairpin-helix domain-containing protein [Saprospiraceae bacterium]
MRKFLTSYFYYSRGERNGVVVLVALSLGFLMIPKIYSIMDKRNSKTDNFSAFEQEIAALVSEKASDTEGGTFAIHNDESTLFPFNPNSTTKEDLIRLGLSPKVATTLVHFREKGGRFFKKEDLKKIYGLKEADYDRLEEYITLNSDAPFAKSFDKTPQYEAFKKPVIPIVLRPFDPNTATETELLGLGLDEKTVKILLKYREKGGFFQTKEDLKKVYGLSDIDFLRIQPYIQIAENHTIASRRYIEPQNQPAMKVAENVTVKSVDINRANVDELLQLRGIGRTFAARIIEYRERLGGFASLNQLKEVYGLPDSTIHAITPFLRFTSPPHRKIQINKAAIEELLHPYLTRKQAEAIVRFRVNHGGFKGAEDLKKVGVLSDNMIEKLKPYFIFD